MIALPGYQRLNPFLQGREDDHQKALHTPDWGEHVQQQDFWLDGAGAKAAHLL